MPQEELRDIFSGMRDEMVIINVMENTLSLIATELSDFITGHLLLLFAKTWNTVNNI